jgi:hypothetical protein
MAIKVHAQDTGSKNVPPSNTASALQITPAFTRVPRPGFRDPFSGFCRSQMFEAVKSGRVKSYSIKKPGTSRGVRVIDCDSLRAYIESFGDGQQHDGETA